MRIVWTIALELLLGLAAQAQDGAGPRGEMNFIRIDPILAAMDTNGDGLLSTEEIRKPADAILIDGDT